MIRRMLSLLLAAAMLCAMLPAAFLTASAEVVLPPDEFDDTVSGSCGDNLTWTLNKTTGVLTITGTGEMYDYTNKDSITTAPWGKYYNIIKTVTINDGAVSIGKYAFYNCSAIKKCTIPDSVKRIYSDAFFGCSGLSEISIPDGVRNIGMYAFCECTGLTNLTIPSNMATIHEYTFSGCKGLKSVTIPVGITSINNSAFYCCSGLKDVYYLGTESEWNEISIGSDNEYLTGATIHFAVCAHEHTYHEQTAPTCTDPGCDKLICADCGEVLSEEAIPALGHEIVYHAAQAATCTALGWNAYQTCSRCDYTTYEEIPALGHSYIDHAAQAATCTAIGWYDYLTCARCDYSTYEEIPALGHEIVYHAAQAATCTEIGWNAYQSCSRCDYTSYEEKAALGHDWNAGEITKEPTETEPGEKTFTCQRCGETRIETIPELSHVHVYAAVVSEPTCTEQGFTTHICSCGDSYVDTYVAALGHDVVIDPAVKATCTASGLTEGAHCTRCDYKIAQTVIDAVGHDLIGHEAKAATCTAHGWNPYKTCTRCTYTTYEELPALGHDVVEHEGKAATCTQGGWNAYQTCNRCDYSTYKELPKLWHDFKVTVVAPTCTQKGYTYYECQREGCGYTEKGSWTNALGHTNTHSEHKDATCTEDGYDRMICDDCGKIVSETVLPAPGHDLVNDAVKPATCTETGLTAGKHCTRCDYKVAQEAIPALGHDFKDGKCTRCGAKDPNYKPTEPTTAPTEPTTVPTEPTTAPTEPCDGGVDCPSYKFKDVKAGDWYHEAVDFAVSNGLFNGMSDTTFEPNTPMSRAMLVTVLWRYEGQPKEGTNDFTDVPAGQWYTDAVAWAASNGIVNGVGAGKFDPNGRITREQLAAILFRYSGNKGYDVSRRDAFAGFPDKAKVSSWATDAYGWAVAERLITGNDGKLDPQGNATRAQVATILMRFIENIAKE